MWKTIRVFKKLVPVHYAAFQKPLFRRYLTNGFLCEKDWNKRLESPYLKKINLSDLFYEIENQFSHFGKANALDIDLYTNAVNSDNHLDEVEDIIHKLRLSTGAANLLPSTQHAFIRLMFTHGNIDELIRILDDRLNYGVFMDDYCCILLLNKCLKEKNYKNAARIASIQMMQEDFTHPIVKYMSLFACHNYILNPESWLPKEEIKEEVNTNEYEDEEEKRIRVRYIRNHYFDDHFDLRDPYLLVGKTLWMIGNEIPDSIGRSYAMIGYTLHKKWENLIDHLKSFIELKEEQVVFKDSIVLVRDFLTQQTNEEKQTEGFPSKKDEILTLLQQLESSTSFPEQELLKVTEDKMKAAVAELESITSNNQIQIYDTWEKNREQLIQEHIEKVKREKAIAEIKSAKQTLKEKEEELFFFENEDKLDVQIENKRVIYPKKWLGKHKPKRSVDLEYIPPEVQKRKEN